MRPKAVFNCRLSNLHTQEKKCPIGNDILALKCFKIASAFATDASRGFFRGVLSQIYGREAVPMVCESASRGPCHYVPYKTEWRNRPGRYGNGVQKVAEAYILRIVNARGQKSALVETTLMSFAILKHLQAKLSSPVRTNFSCDRT